MILFVYGTLRRGQSNHRLLHGRARFIGDTRTGPAFHMWSLGGFPGIAQGGALAVVGELYEVGVETLRDVDRLEGHPRFYRRVVIRLACGTEASAYVLPKGGIRTPQIISGDWLQHQRSRKEGTS